MGNEREMGYRTSLIERAAGKKKNTEKEGWEGLTGFDKSVGNNGPSSYPRNRGQPVNDQLLPVSVQPSLSSLASSSPSSSTSS